MAILNNTQVVDRTGAINLIKPAPKLIDSLGVYDKEFVGSDAVTFDVKADELKVLRDKVRNTFDKNGLDATEYDIHTMAIPHYPIEGAITRERLAGVRGFGKETEQAVEQAVSEELIRQRELHSNTAEFIKANMLIKGQLVTEHYGTINMASEFGVTRPSATVSAAALVRSIREATALSQAGLRNGSFAKGYIVLAGSDFFNTLITSESIERAYSMAQVGNPLRNELGEAAAGYDMFTFGNVSFINYADTFGGSTPLLGAAQAVLFPRAKLGQIFYGPVSKLSGIGGRGAELFASSYRDPKDRFVEVESEQNILPVITQFASTVALTMGA